MVLVIKNVDERKLREFKAEAVRRGLRLHEAFEEAVSLWLSKKPAELLSEEEVNHLVYESIRGELRAKHVGKYAVVAEGRFVGSFESLEEVVEALRKLRPRHAVVAKVDEDEEVEREWLGGSMERLSA